VVFVVRCLSLVAVKLKYHRLKSLVVFEVGCVWLAVKLKYHRLKPGGVVMSWLRLVSCKVEAPPAEAWWRRRPLPTSCGLDGNQPRDWIECDLERMQCASPKNHRC
jgi:hypothetical protein